jgi:hypothetical protein
LPLNKRAGTIKQVQLVACARGESTRAEEPQIFSITCLTTV